MTSIMLTTCLQKDFSHMEFKLTQDPLRWHNAKKIFRGEIRSFSASMGQAVLIGVAKWVPTDIIPSQIDPGSREAYKEWP